MKNILNRTTRIRLSVMMFLQFLVNGALLPILSLYLKQNLHFSGAQAGVVMAMSAVAAFVAPIVGSFIADKLLRTERLYALCQLFAAGLMLILSFQTRFPFVVLMYLLYALIYGPTNALANVIVFHHATDVRRGYGGIRLWGTVGWVVIAWVFGFFWLRGGGGLHMVERLPDALKVSAIASLVLGIYALSLPRGQERTQGRASIVPVESLRVLRQPAVALFLGFALLVAIIDAFYMFGTSLYLARLGFPGDAIMPLMSLGQLTEIASMALLGFLLGRFGFRRVLAAGVAAELIRFTIFAIGAPRALMIGGLVIHGFTFALFSGSAYVFLDTHSTLAARAGVQQLFMIVTGGFGSLCGSLLAGKMFDIFVGPTGVSGFHAFWALPAVAAGVIFVGLVRFVKEPPPS